MSILTKVLLITAFIYFILPTQILSQNSSWFWQNPYPQGNNLNKIYFFDESTGWIVGNRGTFLKLNNESHWQVILNDSIREDISSVTFRNKTLGWASSAAIGSTQQGSIFKSTNGGESWIQFYSFNTKLYDVFFVSDNIGWTVGNGIISKTTDGGISWNNQLLNNSFNFNTCYFADSLKGWAVGNALFHTMDGGQSWIQQRLPVSGTYSSISFANNMNGWIAGYLNASPNSSSLINSSDGGETWFEYPLTSSGLTCVVFVSDSTGWISNKSGTILKTTDGGDNWFTISNYSVSVDYICFIDLYNGWSVSPWGIIRQTTDGGVNWTKQSGGFAYNFISAFFIDSIKGWAIGGDVTKIVRTTDGGETWSICYEWTGNNIRWLKKITFIDDLYGWVVGYTNNPYPIPPNPLILITTNGGQSWSAHQPQIGLSEFLDAVEFIDRQTGFTGRYNLFKTTDGGWGWSNVCPNIGPIFDIFFLNSLTGWVSAAEGKIYKTTDSGNTWDLIGSGQDTVIYSLYFLNDEIGWAGGWGGLLMHTTDGGYTWQKHNVGQWAISSIYFTDINKGWAVGDNRRKTIDGGQNWEGLWIPAERKINNVQFVSDKLGWFTGNRGTVLKYYVDEPNAIEIEEIEIRISEYKLLQNYPNPFNPTTTINFQIPELSFVTIKVYDVLGCEIKTLVNEKKSAGSYDVEWNGKGLPSGIYFYRLQAGNFVETKKMVLLR